MIRILYRVTLMFALLVSPARVLAFCHELEVVQQGGIIRTAAAARRK